MALILDTALAAVGVSASYGRGISSCSTSSPSFIRFCPAAHSSPFFLPANLQFRLKRSSVPIARAYNSVTPTKNEGLDEQLKHSISDAQEICAGNDASEECAVAWDEVEEISAAMADKRSKAKVVSDPLEEFCKDNPETDECRVYED